MNDRITIAIPFYKGRSYLACAIHSVLAQDSPNWDLLICDDCGSDEDVPKLVSRFNDTRIRYLQNPHNLGMSGNWNRCMKLAGNDLVSLLHDDDELEPCYVSLILSQAKQHEQATGIFCNACIIDQNGKSVPSHVDFAKRFLVPSRSGSYTLHGEPGVTALMRGNFIMCPTMCYRKSRLPDEWFRPSWKFVHDLEFFVRILMEGGDLVGVAGTGYRYRRHSANATTAYTASMLRFVEESQLHDQIAELAAQRGWHQAARMAAAKWPIKLHLAYRILLDFASFDFGQAFQKIGLFPRLFRRASTPLPVPPETSRTPDEPAR